MPNLTGNNSLDEFKDVLDGAVESRSVILTDMNAAVVAVPAKPFSGGARRDIRFVNEGPQDIWIREFPADEDPGLHTGSILLGGGDSVTFYDTGAIYMGEISAIAENGTPNLHVTVL